MDSEKRASSNKLVEIALSCSLDKEIDNYSKNVRILSISGLKDENGLFWKKTFVTNVNNEVFMKVF